MSRGKMASIFTSIKNRQIDKSLEVIKKLKKSVSSIGRRWLKGGNFYQQRARYNHHKEIIPPKRRRIK
jgi:hypothetical protein